MKRYLPVLSLVLVVGTLSWAQTDSSMVAPETRKSDKGHWLAVRVGFIAVETDITNQWTILGGYEGRFAENWSVPIEVMAFNDPNRTRTSWSMSVALKVRFPLLRSATNVYAQGGIGSGYLFYTYHYAVGCEYGLFDRLSLYLQIKKFSRNIDIDRAFVSLGININATSERLRRKYEEEKGP